MLHLGAYLGLIRPLNLLITAAGVILGGVLALESVVPGSEPIDRLLGAALAAMLVAAGGNSINDVFDLRIDAINRPDRPLPSGRLSIGAARGVWAICTLAGIFTAAMVSPLHLGVAATAAALLYVYSAHLKPRPYSGNAVIASLVALAILFGGWAVGSSVSAYVAAGFAFLTTFARELIKDMDDVEGDREEGARTAPIVFGVAHTRLVATAVLVLTILLTPIPFLTMDYGPLFLFLVLFVDLILLRVVWLLPNAPRTGRSASSWMKTAMVGGIL